MMKRDDGMNMGGGMEGELWWVVEGVREGEGGEVKWKKMWDMFGKELLEGRWGVEVVRLEVDK